MSLDGAESKTMLLRLEQSIIAWLLALFSSIRVLRIPKRHCRMDCLTFHTRKPNLKHKHSSLRSGALCSTVHSIGFPTFLSRIFLSNTSSKLPRKGQKTFKQQQLKIEQFCRSVLQTFRFFLFIVSFSFIFFGIVVAKYTRPFLTTTSLISVSAF